MGKGDLNEEKNRLEQEENYPEQNINIANGTKDPRVEFISQNHSSQFTNLEHITIPKS